MKNTQIIALVSVFLACVGCGFFLGRLIFEDKPAVEEEIVVPVQEEIVLSTVPVIESYTEPVLSAGKYSFNVQAYVESEDSLKYVLCRDEACDDVVAALDVPEFTNIPPIQSKTYYLLVQNTRTYEISDIIMVEGFDMPVVMYRKVTVNELNELFNGYKEWSKAPQHVVAVNNGLRLSFTGLDEAREARPAKSLSDVVNKCKQGIWQSAQVLNVSHDPVSGRLTNVSIHVIYPEE